MATTTTTHTLRATTVGTGIMASISSSTRAHLGDTAGTMAGTMAGTLGAGATLTTMATMIHGDGAAGMTLGTMAIHLYIGATMADGVDTMVASMVDTMADTTVGMPTATGMAMLMVGTMVAAIGTTAPIAPATDVAQVGTMIELHTALSMGELWAAPPAR